MNPVLAQLSGSVAIGSPVLWGVLISALGMWTMISGPGAVRKWVGPMLGTAGLILLGIGMRLSAPLPHVEQVTFWLLAVIAVGGAATAVAARNPIYTALWFAFSLLGVAGLFVLQHAQFLGVATVVVYAGAIIVTFLFVLMLAQPDGQSSYDRLSWASFAPLAGTAAATCFVVLLISAIMKSDLPESAGYGRVTESNHLARFGAELFSRHMIAVELVGTLLLVALAGAIAIVIHGRTATPQQSVVGPPVMDDRLGGGERMTAGAAELYNHLLVGGLLFAIGAVGFLVRRNMIVMFLSVEIMLQGVSLSLVAWSQYHNDWGGQMLVVFAIAVAACEAGLALALILMLFHERGTLDITAWQDLREEGQPAFVDRKVPEESVESAVWPTLTPAGVRPEVDEDELAHRSRV